MTKYIERNYGADADGNRGITYVEYELSSEDDDEVREQIITIIKDLVEYDGIEEVPETVEITLTDEDGYDVTFPEVHVSDYFTITQLNKILKDNQ